MPQDLRMGRPGTIMPWANRLAISDRLLGGACHDAERTGVGGLESPRSRIACRSISAATAPRASRPSPMPSCVRPWGCQSGRSAFTTPSSSWPSSTRTCWNASTSTPSSWAGDLPRMSVHWADWVLPDGSPCQMPAWALPLWEGGQWVLKRRQRPGDRRGCPTGPSTSSSAIGRSWSTTTWTACREALEDVIWVRHA